MTNAAPALLVSVRSASEALDALAGGADWIDLKEPRRGALGGVDAGTARDVVHAVGGRTSLSAAAGELLEWDRSPHRELVDVAGISHFKLGLAGLAGSDWKRPWLDVRAQLAAASRSLVAVIYADAASAAAPRADQVLDAAIASGAPWILWDTFDKRTGPLTSHLAADDLLEQLAAARAAGLRTVVAGRLNEAAISRLPLKFIDMVAVRGAACRGSRDSVVCRDRVRRLRMLLSRHGGYSSQDPLARGIPHATGFSRQD